MALTTNKQRVLLIIKYGSFLSNIKKLKYVLHAKCKTAIAAKRAYIVCTKERRTNNLRRPFVVYFRFATLPCLYYIRLLVAILFIPTVSISPPPLNCMARFGKHSCFLFF
jgi:hypothetical protein